MEKEIAIRIQRLDKQAQIPTKGSKLAAGHDLYSIEDILIPANNRALVKIGLAIAVPEGTYSGIAPRSGLASKGITVDVVVIDADYRGEVNVLLVNHGKMDYQVKIGERIVQLIVERIDDQEWMEMDRVDETERAGKGFGSSGTGLELKETQPTICFLQADGNHQFYDSSDINQPPILRKGQELLSNTIIAKANLKGFEANFITKVRELAEEDLGWRQRKEKLESLKEKGKELPKQWSISDGLLYYEDGLFIPANEDLQTLIAKGCYDSEVAGHIGQEETLELITRDFYWKALTNWVNDYVCSCTACQQAKVPRHARLGLLNPLQVPYTAWASTSVHFITQLPKLAGYTQIMVVVDRLTKMAHFIGLEEKATARDVAESFLKEVWKLHGLPSEIISDMDAKFAGEFWESLGKKLSIKRKMSTAYHPQTDGQTERVNQVLGGYLRIFVNYDQDDWYQLLPLAEFAYNNSVTNAHNMTPFFANYGYHPQTEWLKKGEARSPGANLYTHWMQTIHQQARQSLEKTRQAMGRYYNRKAKQQSHCKIRDMVMLNAKNIRSKIPSKKLAPKLYGPFTILEQRGELAYKLELSERWNIHPIFHVSLLELYRTSIRLAREQPPMEPEEIDGDLEWEVEKIIKSEIISYDRRLCGRTWTIEELRYFVKWRGCSEDENTGEPPEYLERAQELVEDFHRENPDMPRLG